MNRPYRSEAIHQALVYAEKAAIHLMLANDGKYPEEMHRTSAENATMAVAESQLARFWIDYANTCAPDDSKILDMPKKETRLDYAKIPGETGAADTR